MVIISLVVMNADDSSNGQANILFGSKMLIFGWLSYVLILAGIALYIIGALFIMWNRQQAPQPVVMR